MLSKLWNTPINTVHLPVILREVISNNRFQQNLHNVIHGLEVLGLRNCTTSLFMDGIQTWDILFSIRDLLCSVWLGTFLDIALWIQLKDAVAEKQLQIIWVLDNSKNRIQWKHLNLATDAKTLCRPLHQEQTSYFYFIFIYFNLSL